MLAQPREGAAGEVTRRHVVVVQSLGGVIGQSLGFRNKGSGFRSAAGAISSH
jgi:hypothetical protein